MTSKIRPLRKSLVFTRPLIALCFVAACGDAADDLLPGDGDGDGNGTFAQLYATTEFQKCKNCHAPGAQGRVDGTESTQDWSSASAARASLQGNAAGLIGNFEGCNGVPLVGPTPEDSLLVAAFDETIRTNFALAAHPDCTGDAISDMTLKIGGAISASTLTLLKSWVEDGAP
ncbi:MAG: hypothetical protein ABW321_16700 [Polyangiales bacterium]